MLHKFLSIIAEIGACKPEESLLTWNKLKSIKNLPELASKKMLVQPNLLQINSY